MTTPRQSQTATLLQNGQVLVIGGVNSTGTLTSAELYDPATGKWSATGSPGTGIASSGYTTTVLQNGQVLVTGGEGPAGVTSSAELYNPATGTWSATGSMTTARVWHTATLLPNGQVLVADGQSCLSLGCAALASAELYHPASGTWTQTGSINAARAKFTATLLPSGQVLVAGGIDGTTALASAELYNPATGTWATTGSLNVARYGQLAGLLPNGQVLVVCGVSPCAAELYNPATGSWTQDGQASPSAPGFTATLLHNGQVLFSGGLVNCGYLAFCIVGTGTLFDTATGTTTSVGNMTIPRRFHTLTVLQNGQVLAAGGQTQNHGQRSATATAELYTP
jgi:hypothetical protein